MRFPRPFLRFVARDVCCISASVLRIGRIGQIGPWRQWRTGHARRAQHPAPSAPLDLSGPPGLSGPLGPSATFRSALSPPPGLGTRMEAGIASAVLAHLN